jgi:hypothetical protein
MESQTFAQSRGSELLTWEVERLWRLAEDLPVKQVPLKEFRAVLETRYSRFWDQEKAAPSHLEIALYLQRVLAGDLAHPILLSAEGEVMDGLHRLTKAWALGFDTIQVVQFSVTPEPDERQAWPPPS